MNSNDQKSLETALPQHQAHRSEPVASQTIQLADDVHLLQATLDSSLDMIQVFQAVRDQHGQINDFIWVLNNYAAQQAYGEVIGQSLLTLNPGVVGEGIFDAFCRVVETGEPDRSERHYVHEQFNGWFYQSTVKLGDGIVTTTGDITQRKQAEADILQLKDDLVRKATEKYHTLFSTIDEGYGLVELLYDGAGQPTDYRFVEVNSAFERQTGLQAVVGKLGSQVENDSEPYWLETYAHVVQTGQTVRFENYHGPTSRWYQGSASTIAGADNRLVALVFNDITTRKQAQQALQESEERFRVYLTATSDFIYRMSADWTIMYQLDGKGYLANALRLDHWFDEYIPEGEQPRVQEAIAEAIARKTIFALEHQVFDAQGSLGWVYSRAVPRLNQAGEIVEWFGAGSNITARKLAEAELREREQQQRFLLELSDDLRAQPQEEAIGQLCTSRLAGFLGLDRCYISQIATEQDWVQVGPEYRRADLTAVSGHYRLSDFPKAFRRVQNRTTVIHDVAGDAGLTQADKTALSALDIGACITAAVRRGKQKGLWSVSIIANKPRLWTSVEVSLLEEVAERTWAALERVKAEEALRESQKRFELIANLVPDLLWDSEPGGSTNWYNQRWLEYTGQRFDEAIGWGWADTIHPDDQEASAKRYGLAVDAGISLQQEHRIRRHDGAYRWFMVSASPLKNENGQVVKMYGAATDMHERKLLEATLLEADRRKDEFLAMLAHELRNPMSTIRSGLQILSLVDANDDIGRSTLAMMNRQTDHLVRMVDDLLDVSRISQGKIELHKGRLDFVEVVSQAIDSTGALFKDQGQSLHLNLPTAPILLDGDTIRLTQVVVNLLTNGVRYTGEAGQVWLSLVHKQQEAILEVRDNGIGLATDQLSAIFELFVQVDNSTARSKGGLGLGLTLVKRLVEMHDGRVEAQSEGVGKGSTFMVHLPTLETAPPTTPNPTKEPASGLAPHRILVIDDNADAALTLAMLLKLKGYETHTRTSGRAGIEAAEQLKPAAILLDIGMPELDGYDTCRLLRQQPWGQEVQVIALSGYGQQEDRQRTREAGFTEHLVKPVDLEALTKLLTILLDQKKKKLD